MAKYLKRAGVSESESLTGVKDSVVNILQQIREEGDAAIRRYSQKFDNWNPERFRVGKDQVRKAKDGLPTTLIEDTLWVQKQIREFAQAQLETMQPLEIRPSPGVVLGHKHIPISAVGAYVPGGRYPLVASAHMSIIPPKVAGVERVIACSPPSTSGGMYPATLFAMEAAGADEIYCIGGVQALAAMAYGSSELKPVDMIVGAGNAYVAEAKRQLFGLVGIDLLAGPTEILIVADERADAAIVAADLLGQAEHDPNARAILITTSESLGEEVVMEIKRQLEELPTRDIAAASWRAQGEIVLADSRMEATQLADSYAPEHLEIQTKDDDWYFEQLRNYGSLFIGEPTTVAHSDKVLGPNHILPTNRAARYTGGLWVGKFLKTVTYQKLTEEASCAIAGVTERQCNIEGMIAHGITARVRADKYC